MALPLFKKQKPGIISPALSLLRPRRKLWRAHRPAIIRPREYVRETMLAPSYVSMGSGGAHLSASSGETTPTYPTTVTAGNVLFATVWMQDTGIGGGVEIYDDGTWTEVSQFSTTVRTFGLFTKVATGSESGTATFSGLYVNSPPGQSTGCIFQFSGVDTGSPPYYENAANLAVSQTSNYGPPSLTTLGADRLALFFVIRNSGGITSTGSITGNSGGTWSIGAQDADISNSWAHGFHQASMAAAGTISGGSTSSSTNFRAGVILGLKPAPTASSMPPRMNSMSHLIGR